MKLLKNTTQRLSRLGLIVLLGGCAGRQAATAPAQSTPKTESLPKFVDIPALPIAEEPDALGEMAESLCRINSSAAERMQGSLVADYALDLQPGSRALGLIAGRCAYLAAEMTEDGDEILALAKKGMAAVENLKSAKDESGAAAMFYYGVNLGLYIQEKGLLAVGRLGEMEQALVDAAPAEEIDLGAPLRALGMLYLKAPPWPTGVGDLETSIEILAEAAHKFPVHPLNRFFYAQALAENDQRDEALTELNAARMLAHPNLWGPIAENWRRQILEFQAELGN